MKRAHLRILHGIGHDNFKSRVFDRFPLALDDSSVLEVAESIGWDQAWMQVRRNLPTNPAAMNHNIAAMLAKAGVALHGHGPQAVGVAAPSAAAVGAKAPGVAVPAKAAVTGPPAKASGLAAAIAPAKAAGRMASPAKASGHHVPKTGARVAVMAPPSSPVMAPRHFEFYCFVKFCILQSQRCQLSSCFASPRRQLVEWSSRSHRPHWLQPWCHDLLLLRWLQIRR